MGRNKSDGVPSILRRYLWLDGSAFVSEPKLWVEVDSDRSGFGRSLWYVASPSMHPRRHYAKQAYRWPPGGYTALSTKGVSSLLSTSLYKIVTYPVFYLLLAIL